MTISSHTSGGSEKSRAYCGLSVSVDIALGLALGAIRGLAYMATVFVPCRNSRLRGHFAAQGNSQFSLCIAGSEAPDFLVASRVLQEKVTRQITRLFVSGGFSKPNPSLQDLVLQGCIPHHQKGRPRGPSCALSGHPRFPALPRASRLCTNPVVPSAGRPHRGYQPYCLSTAVGSAPGASTTTPGAQPYQDHTVGPTTTETHNDEFSLFVFPPFVQ